MVNNAFSGWSCEKVLIRVGSLDFFFAFQVIPGTNLYSFSFPFSLHDVFCYFSPPCPHHFSNNPSLRDRGRGGGEGILSSHENRFFSARFFSFLFSLRELFLAFPPPHPHHFSNSPSPISEAVNYCKGLVILTSLSFYFQGAEERFKCSGSRQEGEKQTFLYNGEL